METVKEGPGPSTSEQNALDTLELLKRLCGVSDDAIARHSGMSRQAVHNRRSGVTAIGLADVDGLAEAFNVPVSLFLMDLDEVRNWLLRNPPGNAPCMTQKKYYESSVQLDLGFGLAA